MNRCKLDMLVLIAAASLALALHAPTLRAQADASSVATDKTASQCFVIYRIAAGLPGNAGHKQQLLGLGGLMGRTMQDGKVSQQQFSAWTDELMKRIGSARNPNLKAMSSQVDTCNAFAKQRYRFYAARK